MAGDNFVVWRERKTEDIGLDSARSRSGSMKVGQASPPDPEMVEKASRRRFTAEYKPNINMCPFLVPTCNGFLLGQSSPG